MQVVSTQASVLDAANSSSSTSTAPSSSKTQQSKSGSELPQADQVYQTQAQAQMQTNYGASTYAYPSNYTQTPYGTSTYAHPSNHGCASKAQSLTDFMLTVTGILNHQHVRLAESLNPQFTILRAEIASAKNEVKDEVSKVKQDVQSVIEAHKMGHSAIAKALQGIAVKAKALEDSIGESQLGHPGDSTRTLMGRLDEVYLALGDMVENLTDSAADGAVCVFLPRQIC
jgi:hypothetical protein